MLYQEKSGDPAIYKFAALFTSLPHFLQVYRTFYKFTALFTSLPRLLQVYRAFTSLPRFLQVYRAYYVQVYKLRSIGFGCHGIRIQSVLGSRPSDGWIRNLLQVLHQTKE
jgi:hypothetical protein